MDELAQRDQLGDPGENPPGPGCFQYLLVLLFYGAMLVFSPEAFLAVTLFVTLGFLLAIFISLFLKRWFSSWKKTLGFSQNLLWWSSAGALVVFTFLYS
jgi:hypothetical protein